MCPESTAVDPTDVAPAWTWGTTAVVAFLAVLSVLVGGVVPSVVTAGLGALTVVGVVYLLYRWGQYREPPSRGSDDETRRENEKKMEAEAGGYGGDSGAGG